MKLSDFIEIYKESDLPNITCSTCFYGRNLDGDDWGCRNMQRQIDGLKLVNKGDYSCEYKK